MTVQWASPEQRSERELIDNLIKKIQLGVPQDVLLEEYGYAAEDLTRFRTLKAAETALNDQSNPSLAAAIGLNG